MTKISFIYLDVGGVAIKDFSDTPKWDKMISEALGIPLNLRDDFDQIFDQYEDDICQGKIEVDAILPYIKERFGAVIPDGFSILDYMLDHFEKNEEMWEVIKHVDPQVPIGLLTDQYLGLLKGIFARDLLPKQDFATIVDSSVVGYRKPMQEIYQIAQDRANVPANEILFIDNRQKNLDPAIKLGWQNHLYDSSDYVRANRDLSVFFGFSVN
jgi:putative hydrolase of the HAD superfamily